MAIILSLVKNNDGVGEKGQIYISSYMEPGLKKKSPPYDMKQEGM